MTIDDVWIIQQEWRYQNESALYGGHFREVEGLESDLEQAGISIAAHFDPFWTALLIPKLSDEVEVICTTAKKVTAPGSRIFTFYGAGVTGDVVGPPIQAGEAVLGAKYTAVNSATTRGRIFAPFIAAVHKSVNQILDSSKLVLTVMLEAMLRPDPAEDVDNVGEMCGVVWSDKLKTSEDITNIDLRPVLASQRGRVERHQNFG